MFFTTESTTVVKIEIFSLQRPHKTRCTIFFHLISGFTRSPFFSQSYISLKIIDNFSLSLAQLRSSPYLSVTSHKLGHFTHPVALPDRLYIRKMLPALAIISPEVIVMQLHNTHCAEG